MSPVIDFDRTSPRGRLLATAADLFYALGIHAVGVDRVVSDAQTTRATFYRHFPSKDDLVVAYLREVDRQGRQAVADAQRRGVADDVEVLFDLVADFVCLNGFRGCPFINAAAEYPDPSHPIHVVVSEHRDWFLDFAAAACDASGHPDPPAAALEVLMLKDGASMAAYLGDADRATDIVRDAVRRLLRHR